MTYVRRRLGEQVQYFGVWEDQQRGVLHRHFLLRIERPTTERRVRAAVRGAARRWGFGAQYDVQAITGDAAREAWYCAKYATKTADSIDGRDRLDPVTGELKATRGFRPWSCSRSWGDTMATVKARQRCWAILEVSGGRGAGAAGAGLDLNPEISTMGSEVHSEMLVSSSGELL